MAKLDGLIAGNKPVLSITYGCTLYNNTSQYPFIVVNSPHQHIVTDSFMFFSLRKLGNRLGANFVQCYYSCMPVSLVT
jgi:hypothetical protein